jgi:hypothetical protein
MIPKLTTALSAVPTRWRGGLAAFACALLLGSYPVLAQQDEAKRIRDELALVQQEQQAVFQQFQMMHELRRGLENPPPTPPPLTMYDSGQSPPNYYDQVAAQQERAQRLVYYGQEMDRLFARYQELDARRKVLLEELGKITGNR